MEQIYEPNEQFPFDKLVLTNPIFVNAGTYFIKYHIADTPLYIQPPKCITRQSFIKAGKKMYCDLLFTNENEEFIQWMENLENYSQKYIFNNRSKWFETELEMHDIENSFTSPLKLYKSGKYYIVRTSVPSRLGKCTLRIFDEHEMEVPMESIQDGTTVMTILEVQGIKCSTRSFQIDLEIKQMMVIPKSTMFERCVITKKSSPEDVPSIQTTEETTVHQQEQIHVKPSNQGIENIILIPDDDKVETGHIRRDDVAIADSGVIRRNAGSSRRETSRLEDVIEHIQENIETVHDETKPLVENSFDEPLSKSMECEQNTPIHECEEIELVDFEPTQLEISTDFHLKSRDDVYYDLYVTAKKKAEEARNLAISAYLEAKRIKDLYKIHEPLDILSEMPHTGGEDRIP